MQATAAHQSCHVRVISRRCTSRNQSRARRKHRNTAKHKSAEGNAAKDYRCGRFATPIVSARSKLIIAGTDGSEMFTSDQVLHNPACVRLAKLMGRRSNSDC
jgi:hypothetical protein